MGLLWETTLSSFLVVTILAGGAAWMSGRAIARAWEPAWHAMAWMLVLGAAARFIHFALYDGTLLSIRYYLVQTAILVAVAAIAHRFTLTRLMTGQYGFLYERTSPFGWRRRTAPAGE